VSQEPKPAPVTTFVCTACGEPWSLHFQSAMARVQDEHTDDDDDELYQPSEVETEAAVDTRDCILALQRRNQGPMGPPGPMGYSG
jgi:hypothetical protein